MIRLLIIIFLLTNFLSCSSTTLNKMSKEEIEKNQTCQLTLEESLKGLKLNDYEILQNSKSDIVTNYKEIKEMEEKFPFGSPSKKVYRRYKINALNAKEIKFYIEYMIKKFPHPTMPQDETEISYKDQYNFSVNKEEINNARKDVCNENHKIAEQSTSGDKKLDFIIQKCNTKDATSCFFIYEYFKTLGKTAQSNEYLNKGCLLEKNINCTSL